MYSGFAIVTLPTHCASQVLLKVLTVMVVLTYISDGWNHSPAALSRYWVCAVKTQGREASVPCLKGNSRKRDIALMLRT